MYPKCNLLYTVIYKHVVNLLQVSALFGLPQEGVKNTIMAIYVKGGKWWS
jgi:hypothetical protein